MLINNFKHAVSEERTISKEETNNGCMSMLLTNPNDMAMESESVIGLVSAQPLPFVVSILVLNVETSKESNSDSIENLVKSSSQACPRLHCHYCFLLVSNG